MSTFPDRSRPNINHPPDRRRQTRSQSEDGPSRDSHKTWRTQENTVNCPNQPLWNEWTMVNTYCWFWCHQCLSSEGWRWNGIPLCSRLQIPHQGLFDPWRPGLLWSIIAASLPNPALAIIPVSHLCLCPFLCRAKNRPQPQVVCVLYRFWHTSLALRARKRQLKIHQDNEMREHKIETGQTTLHNLAEAPGSKVLADLRSAVSLAGGVVCVVVLWCKNEDTESVPFDNAGWSLVTLKNHHMDTSSCTTRVTLSPFF